MYNCLEIMVKFSVLQNFIFMASFDKSQWYVLICIFNADLLASTFICSGSFL